MKFSIRDLFLVTMIVAILLAWYVDHRREAARYKEMTNSWNKAFYERGVLQAILAIEKVQVEFRDGQKPLVTDEDGKTWEFGGGF